MKNPFRTRYRIVEYNRLNDPYEPQIWRWFWPFWCELVWGTCTGYDYSPWSYSTYDEARMAIERHRAPAVYASRTVHEVP